MHVGQLYPHQQTMGKKSRSKPKRAAPYAWVSDTDGCGCYAVGGVIPLRDGTFDVHVLVIRTADGIRDGYWRSGDPTDVSDLQTTPKLTNPYPSPRAVVFPLSAAYELFVRVPVERTPDPMPEDAPPEIEFFRRFSSPLAPEHARLVFERLTAEALARAGASTNLDTVPGISADAVEACREQVTEDMQNPRRDPARMKFARHYPNVWYVNMGELLGIGFDVGVFTDVPSHFDEIERFLRAPLDLRLALAKSPRHVDRLTTMAHHTSVLYSLEGDETRAAAWATARDIGLAAFHLSPLTFLVSEITMMVHSRAREVGGADAPRYWWGNNEVIEQRAIDAVGWWILSLRDAGANGLRFEQSFESPFMALAHMLALDNIKNGITDGVYRAREVIPGFPTKPFNSEPIVEKAKDELSSQLFCEIVVTGYDPTTRIYPRIKPLAQLPVAAPAELKNVLATGYEAGGFASQPAAQVADLVVESLWTRVVRVAYERYERTPVGRAHVEHGIGLLRGIFTSFERSRRPLECPETGLQFPVPAEEAPAHGAWAHAFDVTDDGARLTPEFCAAVRAGDEDLKQTILGLAATAPGTAMSLLCELVSDRAGTYEEIERRTVARADRAVRAGTAHCAGCGKSAVDAGLRKLRKCAGCGRAEYCSRACQKQAWPAHKAACRAARNEEPGTPPR